MNKPKRRTMSMGLNEATVDAYNLAYDRLESYYQDLHEIVKDLWEVK